MPIIKINSLKQPEIAIYASLTEAQLRNRLNPEEGIFIAESPKVINVALQKGLQPISIVCEEKHIYGDASFIIDQFPELQVYTGERELLAQLTGYTLTRGVLCAMKRPQLPSVEDICAKSKRVVIIDGVVDATNIGSIFRAAAAIGFDAVLLTKQSCDPFNRRAVRVSMGSTFLVPWTWLDNDANSVKNYGFKTAAMALSENSVSIDYPPLRDIPKLALIMGTEGDGLNQKTILASDFVVKIPMFHNVDSLNVASAAAVAFWELRNR